MDNPETAREEEKSLRASALQTGQSILVARQRAEQELMEAKEALEVKTKELAHSLAVVRATLDSTTDGLLVVDEHRQVTGFNDQFVTMWQFPATIVGLGSREKLLAHAVTLLKEPEKFLAQTEKIYASSPPETFDVLELHDGRVFERFSKVQSIEGRNVGRVWSYRDVTERRRAEEAARMSHARFAAIINQSPVGIFLLDAQLRFQHVNPKAIPALGEIEGFIGRDFSEVVHILWPEKVADELLQQYRHTLETGEPFFSRGFTEVRQDRKAKEYYDWEIHRITLPDNQQGLVCYFMDVSAHMLAQEALQRSEQDLLALADSIPQLAWMAAPDGNIFWYNRGWYAYTGTTFEQMEGWRWQSVHDPSTLPAVIERWQASINSGEPFEMEFPLRGSDGVFRWFLTRVNPLRDDKGCVLRWFGTNTDVDRVKRAEADRERSLAREKEARAQAERASSAKDEFLAALSHELRTPLTPVLMTASTLRDDPRLPADVREQLAMMKRNIELEARLIDDLLDLTRIAHGKLALRMEVCDAHSLVAHAFEMVRSEASAKSIVVELDLRAPHPHVIGDPARLQQVFWNLLKNAVKFTPDSGRILVQSRENDGKLALQFQDTGIGIKPDAVGKIFLPFEQAAEVQKDRKFGGLGLGLSISKAILDGLDGKIRVESEGEGRGAKFLVEIPLTHSPLEKDPGTDAAPGKSSKARPKTAPLRLRMLLVEDHEATIEVLRRLLVGAGHHVTTAKTVASAMEAAQTATFDIVISDLGLPDGTGFQLMRNLRNTYNLRGIALSGYGMEEDLQRSLKAGFVAHLTKPIDFSHLQQAVRVASEAGH